MVKLSKETHLEMFTKMERIREFDSRINKLVRRGFVQGMTFQITVVTDNLSPKTWI